MGVVPGGSSTTVLNRVDDGSPATTAPGLSPTGPVDGATLELRLLDFSARVRGPTWALTQLRQAFPTPPAWTLAGEPAAAAEISVVTGPPSSPWYQIRREGDPIWSSRHDTQLVAALEWVVTLSMLRTLASRYQLLHAGAVAFRDCGILLPAGSGRGKSTLTAALAGAGFRFLGDDVVALEPERLHLLPIARAPALKQGGLAAIAALHPRTAPSLSIHRLDGERVWFLPVPSATWPNAPVAVHCVVFPTYKAGARSAAVRISRSEALERLLPQRFQSEASGLVRMQALVQMLQRAECWSLTVGDLGEAVDLVSGIVSGSAADDPSLNGRSTLDPLTAQRGISSDPHAYRHQKEVRHG